MLILLYKLHAGYGPKDRYKAHRATECWQLSNILRASAAMGRHIIMVNFIIDGDNKEDNNLLVWEMLIIIIVW
jgi:hypothetical protein